MMFARLERHRRRFQAVPWTSRGRGVPKERISDCWPDWSAEVREPEWALAGKNKPSVILREAACAVVYAIGLVVFLMTVLNVLHIR